MFRTFQHQEFKSSPIYSIGVEVEFQLVDQNSLALAPRAPEILQALSRKQGAYIKKEFIQSMLEVTTGICANMAEVERDLMETTRYLEEKAKKADVLLHPTSLHPFSRASEQRLTDDPRYRKILEDLKIVGQRLITQGLHVHIGVPDGDTAIKVVDHMRSYLPLILTLTASSPFFEGVDTGLHSFRTKLLEALPRSGIPAELRTWKEFVGLATTLMELGVISDIRDIWWDVRPHPYFGTVEVRIADVPPRMKEILAVAALIHTLVVHIADTRRPRLFPHRLIIANNKWQAARYAMDGAFVDMEHKRRITQKDAIKTLLATLEKRFFVLGNEKYVDTLMEILELGPGSLRQRSLREKGYTFEQIIRQNIQGFWG